MVYVIFLTNICVFSRKHVTVPLLVSIKRLVCHLTSIVLLQKLLYLAFLLLLFTNF